MLTFRPTSEPAPPPLAIAYRATADLVPYARNARTHSAEQVAQIATSIREFGFTNPLLVDEHNGIIAGHGRLLAAQSLGMGLVPVIQLDGLTEAQKAALRLADNRLALSAGWDEGMLREELEHLASLDYNLLLTGFGTDEIDRLLRPAGRTDPDDAPPAPAQPAARLGDVWRLGRHTLACGDATNPAAVAGALGGVVPHLMVTDPPYGVDYDPNWRAYRQGLWTAGYQVASGRVENDDRADWREAWALFPGHVAYVWHAALHEADVVASLLACDFAMRAQIVWVKPRVVISRGHYNWRHEPCLYAVRKGGTAHWAGDRSGDSTIWEIAQGRSTETGHGTQKPVECMRRPMENNSTEGQAVYDPFVGSGTSIIAAEMSGRACHALELSPVYVDVAIQRWQSFTGGTAVLAHSENGGEGLPYAAVLAERVADPTTA